MRNRVMADDQGRMDAYAVGLQCQLGDFDLD